MVTLSNSSCRQLRNQTKLSDSQHSWSCLYMGNKIAPFWGCHLIYLIDASAVWSGICGWQANARLQNSPRERQARSLLFRFSNLRGNALTMVARNRSYKNSVTAWAVAWISFNNDYASCCNGPLGKGELPVHLKRYTGGTLRSFPYVCQCALMFANRMVLHGFQRKILFASVAPCS